MLKLGHPSEATFDKVPTPLDQRSGLFEQFALPIAPHLIAEDDLITRHNNFGLR